MDLVFHQGVNLSGVAAEVKTAVGSATPCVEHGSTVVRVFLIDTGFNATELTPAQILAVLTRLAQVYGAQNIAALYTASPALE